MGAARRIGGVHVARGKTIAQAGQLFGRKTAERQRDRGGPEVAARRGLALILPDGEEWPFALCLRAGLATRKPQQTGEPQRAGERGYRAPSRHYRVAEYSDQPCAAPLTVFAPS